MQGFYYKGLAPLEDPVLVPSTWIPKVCGVMALSLGLQVCKEYLPWGLKYINVTHFGLFGATGFVLCLEALAQYLTYFRGPGASSLLCYCP